MLTFISTKPRCAMAGYGTGEGQIDPFEHYNQYVLEGDENRAGNFAEQQEGLRCIHRSV